jgi:hypothetical protein
MIEALSVELPAARVQLAGGSPLAGALLDAMAEGEQRIAAAVRDRVLQAWHPADFLLTD